MNRYLCVHAHFYQPPRENPWLESLEIQDSAYPYHDWNERVTAECYAPNSASRILDGEGRIMDLVSNYAKISFNFGPTLLSWMEENTPEVYQAILDADSQSVSLRTGHGNSIAQGYNHIIMPLANTRDKRTQIIWGIQDFEHRFKRQPEGMWLPETAVDIETLDILAERGIKFTILAPHQASRAREIGSKDWEDVSDSRLDPTRAYLCNLPSGRKINIFFYDGPISQAVAFEKLLARGEDFASRLVSGFSDDRTWPQILSIATDGETYGHHHKFGDMALAFALNHIESNGLARLTNYGEYLEKHPPACEVRITENSSWSCMHGIERWRNNCGCNSGSYPEWNQEWRAPLRDGLDWLRDQLSSGYEQTAGKYFQDPWKARDGYIDVMINRSEDNINHFFEKYAVKKLDRDETTIALKLLEMQRHAMLMYASCGWFFDEISGIETVQVIQYAARAIQLASKLFNDGLVKPFLEKLSRAESNIPEHSDGANIYKKFVEPAVTDLKKVGVHYAISSLFEDYPEKTDIYCYRVVREDYQKTRAGRTQLALGKICVTSAITMKSEYISFSVIHLGGHDFNGGVRTFQGGEIYQSIKDEIYTALESGSFAEIIRLMDKHFGMHNYSLVDLFKDEQRKILDLVINMSLEEFKDSYRHFYENNRILLGFIQDVGMPIPKVFGTAAEFTLNLDIKDLFSDEKINIEKLSEKVNDIKKWDIALDSTGIELMVRHKAEGMITRLYDNPPDLTSLIEFQQIIEILRSLPFEINFWQMQNIYHEMAKAAYSDFLIKARAGDSDAGQWVNTFRYIGQMLFFNISSVLEEE